MISMKIKMDLTDIGIDKIEKLYTKRTITK